MVRKFFFATLILLTASFVNAQNSRSALKLGVGAAVPLGKFGQREINNSKAGFAKTGPLLNLSFTHLLGQRTWAEVTVQFQQNPLNTSAMEDGFSNTKFYQGLYVSSTLAPPNFPYTTHKNWHFESAEWNTVSLLLGFNGKFPLGTSNKVFARAKLMVGPVYVSSPGIYGESNSGTGGARMEQTSADALSMAYSAGGGIEYDLNSRLYFTTQIDAFGTSSMRFKDIVATLTFWNGTPSNPTTIQQNSVKGDARQSISTLNATVGLGLRL